MHLITCRDCGSQRQTRWKNTQYCLVCRYLRNTKYILERGTKATCVECGERFAPLKRDDKFCAECAPVSRDHPVGTCALCKSDDVTLLARGIAVCRRCAYDPNQRPLFIAALGKKKRARMENPEVIDEVIL